ncbi:MAG TPA: thermonuclease family protein [Caulobacterales bacterium]|nr:thermonuclease family protein [Caulobacterales bacterium]
MPNSVIAFALLIAALIALLASTKQWRLWRRALIWLSGAGLLGVAAFSVLGDPAHYGLFRIVQDAMTAPSRSQTIALSGLASDWRTVSGAVLPMFDIFLAMAAILALAALIAFTPGEAIEQAIRPMKMALIGATAGAFLALTLVAVGFGGTVERRSYFGFIRPDQVHDGDTFYFGDIHVRLAGADAPELGQKCRRWGYEWDCGETAKRRLAALVANALVVCANPDGPEKKMKRSFDRIVAVCKAREPSGDYADLSKKMIEAGQAVAFLEEGDAAEMYREAQEKARGVSKAGIWSTCTLFPDAWRHKTEREAYLRHEAVRHDDVIAGCSS